MNESLSRVQRVKEVNELNHIFFALKSGKDFKFARNLVSNLLRPFDSHRLLSLAISSLEDIAESSVTNKLEVFVVWRLLSLLHGCH